MESGWFLIRVTDFYFFFLGLLAVDAEVDFVRVFRGKIWNNGLQVLSFTKIIL